MKTDNQLADEYVREIEEDMIEDLEEPSFFDLKAAYLAGLAAGDARTGNSIADNLMALLDETPGSSLHKEDIEAFVKAIRSQGKKEGKHE